jgi:hypothetical protein
MNSQTRREKACHYDDAALQKKASRAAKKDDHTLNTGEPPKIRNHVDCWLGRRYGASPPILRPRPVERLTDSELLANELWCRQVFDIVLRRLQEYQLSRQPFPGSILSNRRLCKPFPSRPVIEESTSITSFAKVNTTSHRALAIPEMLEAILRAAAPESQLIACRVSTSWRDMAKFVIQSTAKTSTWWYGI